MTIVQTSAGKVRGAEIADGVLGWRGIPYAAPPVGPLRLRPPQPAVPWSGVRDATTYGNRALQPPVAFPEPGPPFDEDCLYLNVTAPAGAERRPVLLWLHGGGYETGSGTSQAADGAAFARDHGLVVVTFNYRLGALGFLDVEGEAPAGALGLHDQIAALRWVRENIAEFGGDPDQITVYGLSAGGKTVTSLLGSPLTKGMIRRAASSSGGDHVKSAEQARAVAARFFRELGTTPDRIRAVGAADILQAQMAIATPPWSSWIWRPGIDGAALTTHPLQAITSGSAADVALLTQTCARECVYYRLLAPDVVDQADRVLTGYFGQRAWEKMLAAYAADYPELDDAGLRVAVMTDERYVIRVGRIADAQSAHAPVWRSRYDGPHTGILNPQDPDYDRHARFNELAYAAHGSDTPGIWRGGWQGGDPLATRMHDAWGAFVTAGDPGWKRYTTGDRGAMIFDPAGPRVEADPFARARSAWDGLDWQPGSWWEH